MAQHSYRTSETGLTVHSEVFTANKTITTIPAGVRHVKIYIFHRTTGRVNIAGNQWDQATANTEQHLDLWLNLAADSDITVTGTGAISVAWS